MDKPKKKFYELGRNAEVALLIDNFSETYNYYENDSVAKVGRGIAMQWKFSNLETGSEYCEVVMTSEQAKAIVKFLKQLIRAMKWGPL